MRLRILSALVILVILCALFSGCTSPAPSPVKEVPSPVTKQVITIPALVPLTGDTKSYGETGAVGLKLAETEINRYYDSIGAPYYVEVNISNTNGDPKTTRRLAEEIHANGGNIIIGYFSSAELAELKPFTDKNRMLVIATGSTSPDLAIANDSIYRLISDDTSQAKAMGSYLVHENINAVIPLWRDDIWGRGLKNSASGAFSRNGGIMAPGVSYAPGTTSFNTTLSDLDRQAGAVIAQYGVENSGIYAITFNEVPAIMDAAVGMPNLSRIRWFGCDGNLLLPGLTGESAAARFAAERQFSGTMWGVFRPGSDATRVSAAIREKTGREPDAEPLALYDGVWVIASVKALVPGAGPEELKRGFVRQAGTYDGTSNPLMLNDAGDRAVASYDIWGAKSDGGKTGWVMIGQYTSQPDKGVEFNWIRSNRTG
ncbi:MAG: ABC transporter substrate-binding protein [Methanomicrobiales archaeon]|nr:ABC transporter substrate-binding protein [Methanomicrobiales archaeon]